MDRIQNAGICTGPTTLLFLYIGLTWHVEARRVKYRDRILNYPEKDIRDHRRTTQSKVLKGHKAGLCPSVVCGFTVPSYISHSPVVYYTINTSKLFVRLSILDPYGTYSSLSRRRFGPVGCGAFYLKDHRV